MLVGIQLFDPQKQQFLVDSFRDEPVALSVVSSIKSSVKNSAISVRSGDSQKSAAPSPATAGSSSAATAAPVSYKRVLFKALTSPAMLLLLIAAAVRHTGEIREYTFFYVSGSQLGGFSKLSRFPIKELQNANF